MIRLKWGRYRPGLFAIGLTIEWGNNASLEVGRYWIQVMKKNG